LKKSGILIEKRRADFREISSVLRARTSLQAGINETLKPVFQLC
jgi:hypothetical protein